MLKKLKIKAFGSHGVTKNSIVERFNRTLQELLWSYFDYTRGRKYSHIIQKLVGTYNSTIHSSTGLAPKHVNHLNSELVYRNLYSSHFKLKKKKPKFKIDDSVRINRLHSLFDKKFEQKWTRAIYKVASNPYYTSLGILPTYKVSELDGTLLPGKFYETELLGVNKKIFIDNFKFPYEILKQGKKGTLVSWLGYPEKYNSYL